MKKTYSPKANEILDAAEKHMRTGGFDAVSFRDLATEVGMKSASVHYHFPQKTDLGEAVVHRYTQKILDFLGDPHADNSHDTFTKIERLILVYKTALTDGDAVCLCCMLGSEARYLPEPVAAEVENFFSAIKGWAETALSVENGVGNPSTMASFAISCLQGAMTQAIATNNTEHFTVAADLLLNQFKNLARH